MNHSSASPPWWHGLSGTVLALVLLAGCAGEPDAGPVAPTTSGPSGSSPSVTPPTTPTPPTTSPAPAVSSFVYFLIDTRAGVRLARERRVLAGADPATAAVEAMIAGPNDPDYTTTWAPDTRVLAVRRTAGVVEVDLSGEARRIAEHDAALGHHRQLIGQRRVDRVGVGVPFHVAGVAQRGAQVHAGHQAQRAAQPMRAEGGAIFRRA